MEKLFDKVLGEIEQITKGERFISLEQLEEIEEIAYVYTENCGISGTGKGTLYTFYLMDDYGNKTDEELTEAVVTD